MITNSSSAIHFLGRPQTRNGPKLNTDGEVSPSAYPGGIPSGKGNGSGTSHVQFSINEDTVHVLSKNPHTPKKQAFFHIWKPKQQSTTELIKVPISPSMEDLMTSSDS